MSVAKGLSLLQTQTNGRERYVFFSFPHIAIDSRGKVGAILRHNRAEESCACEGLQLCLEHFRKEVRAQAQLNGGQGGNHLKQQVNNSII